MNKKTRNKIIFYVLFFIVGILAFWYLIFYDNDNWKKQTINLSHIDTFHFVNQDSLEFSDKDVANKVVVANFFFTTCKGICPSMNHNLQKIYKLYKDNPQIIFLSHTVDPETDNVSQLKTYSKLYIDDKTNWEFLTGNKLELYRAAREIYKIDDAKNNVGKIEDQFLHTQFFSLVNKKGEIKGIYDGLKEEDLNRLKEEIDLLLKD